MPQRILLVLVAVLTCTAIVQAFCMRSANAETARTLTAMRTDFEKVVRRMEDQYAATLQPRRR